jgi:hypothetical protein
MEALEIARKAARAFYLSEEKKNPAGYPFSPAGATKKAAEKSGLPASRLVPVVAAVYYEENGKRSPVSAKTPKGIATAIRKRRDAGGRLARWEVLASSLAAGETPRDSYPVVAIRAIYENAGGDLAASYTGRGTRVAAPKTRESETAETEV